MTQDQRQALKEFDEHQARIELQLKVLLERRREYVNTNQLNEKVFKK